MRFPDHQYEILLSESGPAPSVAPTNVFANYSTEPQPNPYVVNVQWSKMPSANLYVVQYFQFGEKGEKDAGMILGHEVHLLAVVAFLFRPCLADAPTGILSGIDGYESLDQSR